MTVWPAVIVAAGLLACAGVRGETAATPSPDAITTPEATGGGGEPAPATAVNEPVSVAIIEQKRAELDEAQGLATEIREQIAEHYTKALERIEAATQATAQIVSLRAESARAPQELARLEPLAARPTEAVEAPAAATATDLEQIRAAHREAEAAHEEHRRRLAGLTTEIDRRTSRSRELPDLVSQSRTKLDGIAEQIAAPPAPGEPPELVTARRLRLEASRQLRRQEIELFQQELRTYADTTRVFALEQELAERAVQAAGRTAAALARAVADREKREADARAAEARRAAIDAHPAVREAAGKNSTLAEDHARLVAALDVAREELVRVESLRETVTTQYADTRRRAEEARFSQAVGLLLRSQRAELPDTATYRRRATTHMAEQADLSFRLLDWETERRRLQHLDEAVAADLAKVDGQLGVFEQEDVRAELRGVLEKRLGLYGDLVASARTLLGRLAALQTADDGLVQVVDEQRRFLSQRILWVRSTAPLSPALFPPLVTAVGDLAAPATWRGVVRDLIDDIQARPLMELFIIAPIWLWVIRRRLQTRLLELDREAQRSSVTGLQPTLEALVVTTWLAVPLPGLLTFFGWRLVAVGGGGGPTHALGMALVSTAGVLAAVNFAWIACQPRGLGEGHFGWEPESTAAIRRALGLVRTLALPAAAVSMFTAFLGDDLLTGTVGRLAFITESLALTAITWELFRGTGPLRAMLVRQHPGAWFQATDRLWTAALVAMPLAFAGLSTVGYHYTATQLAVRMAATWGVLALAVGLRALSLRWLLIVYRRLAVRRARERRAELIARQTGEAEIVAELPAIDDRSLELKLSDINEQSQRLVRLAVVGLGLALLTLIWHEIVPAVGYLDRFTLWTSGLPGPGGEVGRITPVELLLAAVWITGTILACRNLPGVLDLMVFQRLPFDAGARYAATAVTQYLLVVLGTVACFRQLGIGWQSVQWLVAAMTVGLGFGLQEIFANFVSGIILLFERPVRVGDIVTIGDVTGTVTRIRIRATTVLDWDCKELIVPNRDFVTGKLINWTLTNPNLRIVIRVGIAYGSDTRLAVRLLEEAARAHPLALADPSPTVVFSQFGASSLDFELRVFTGGVSNGRVLRHELHLAIDDAFRANGIEIAFPQQDLHVRSLPEGWGGQAALQDTPADTAVEPAATTLPKVA
jgi:potassium efflux system protein